MLVLPLYPSPPHIWIFVGYETTCRGFLAPRVQALATPRWD